MEEVGRPLALDFCHLLDMLFFTKEFAEVSFFGDVGPF